MKLPVGVVGVGRMGIHHARVLATRDDVELHVHDADALRVDEVARSLGARAHADLASLIDDVEAVVVATPPANHPTTVRAALAAGRPVLCEKPLAIDARQAAEICALSRGRLMPGHVERYNPVVRALARQLAKQPVQAITTSRLGLAGPRHQGVDALLDLGVHDLDLVPFLAQSPIVELASTLAGEETALLIARLASGVVARVEVTWQSPRKVREIRAWGDGVMFAADLIDGAVERFTRGADGDVRGVARRIPIATGEALEAEIDAFLRAVRNRGAMPITAEDGLRAVQWAERARDVALRGVPLSVAASG